MKWIGKIPILGLLYTFSFSCNFSNVHLGFAGRIKILRDNKTYPQVISHPESYPIASVILWGFGISNYFGGCKEEAGWKKSNMVHTHRWRSQCGPLPGNVMLKCYRVFWILDMWFIDLINLIVWNITRDCRSCPCCWGQIQDEEPRLYQLDWS